MNRTRARRLWIPVACILLTAGSCDDYNEIMVKQVERALGPDYKSYDYFSYPTNNFGLATSYVPTDGKADDGNFLCDTWNCLGVNSLPSDPQALMSVNGFAAVGGDGGQIALAESQRRELALNAVLPEIYRVVSVDGGFDAKRVQTTSLLLGPAFPRKLRRIEMAQYINGLPASHPIRSAFDRGDLAMVVADVVVSSMKVDVTVDQQGATSLDAMFDPNMPKVKVFDGGSLRVKMSSAAQGTYTFEVTQPVVVARLVKHQPAAGVLADDPGNDWEDWIRQAADEPARTRASTVIGNARD